MNDEINRLREKCYDTGVEAQHSYDKALISLSSGALALSLGFIANVVDVETAKYLFLLKISWGLFTLTLTIMVFAFLLTVKGAAVGVDQIDEDKVEVGTFGGIWNKMVPAVNLIAGILFVVGLCHLVLFVTMNV